MVYSFIVVNVDDTLAVKGEFIAAQHESNKKMIDDDQISYDRLRAIKILLSVQ